MREVIEGRSEVGKLYMLGIITDEYKDSKRITLLLKDLSERTSRALFMNLRQPPNFLGVGGMKVFRDIIYSMKGLMRDDHKFYKKHKLYDFPQKNYGMRIMMFITGFFLRFKFIRRKFAQSSLPGMIKMYSYFIKKNR